MFKGLQAKMVLILVLLTVSSMAIIGVVLVNSVTSFYSQDFARQMSDFFDGAETQQLAGSAKDSGELFDTLSVYSSQLGMDTYRNLYILDMSGGMIEGTNPRLGQALVKTENMIKAMNGERGAENDAGETYMDFALPVGTQDGESCIVYIKDTKEEVRDLSWVMIIIIIKTVVIAIFIALVLSFFLAGAITRPVKNITKGAAKIREGDFSYQLKAASKDEIGELTDTFNDMAHVLDSTLSKIEDERAKLSTIFLYMTDGVVAFDSDGVLLHINEAAAKMLGRSYIVGVASFGTIFEGVIGHSFAQVREKMKDGTFVQEIDIDSKIYRCDFAAFSQEKEGGIIAVMHDVTEMTEIDRSRREFIANVSHELRTPLTNVKSYTETVVENDDMPQEDKTKFLGVVLTETDRMINIVKDLLVLSRLDSRKMEITMAPFMISETVADVCNAMKIEADKHSQTIESEVEDNIPPVLGDKNRIEQVLVNIVSNSVKYTPDGGRIEIRSWYEGGKIKVSVKDNGMGIPEDSKQHIFERFYRVDKARSREQGGTGLGLSIAKEIVEAHGGSIEMTSAVGRGTTVTITLSQA